MSRILSEIAATFNRDKCCDKGVRQNDLAGGGIIILVVLALVLCLCCGGGGFGGFGGVPHGKPKKACDSTCGGTGILGAGTGILLPLLFLALFLGGDFLGLGASQGNINTNVVNVDTQDDYCDDDTYIEDCYCSQKC